MNYILQIKAFYDRLETNPLNSSEIALWHALMATNNKTAWSDKFAVASSVLCLKSGLQTRNFYKARNVLQQAGLITWESRSGNQSAIYRITRLYEPLHANNAHSSSYSGSGSSAHSSARSGSPLNKQDTNVNSNQTGLGSASGVDPNSVNATPTREQAFQKIEQEFGRPLSGIEMQTIAQWFDQDGFTADLVILALRVAVLSQAYSLKYMDRVLLNWHKRNITTPEQVEADQRRHEQRTQKDPSKAVGENAVPQIPLFKLGETNS